MLCYTADRGANDNLFEHLFIFVIIYMYTPNTCFDYGKFRKQRLPALPDGKTEQTLKFVGKILLLTALWYLTNQ